jgi:Pheophorbide a oxygenase
MYHYRTRINNTGDYRTNLNIHIVPIEAGRSRVLFGSVLPNWLPTWLKHAASNRFLNTDAWLHNAEYQARMRSSKYSPYLFPTQSDIGVKAFRQWWSRHGFSTAPVNTFGPAAVGSIKLLDRAQQIDPWKHHSQQCASCRKALKIMKRTKVGGLAVAIVSAVVLRRWPIPALVMVALGLSVRHLSIQFATIIEGNPHPSGYADRSPAHQQT